MTTWTPRTAARFLAAYAKDHGAGAFATPTAKELSRHPESIQHWTSDTGQTVAVAKTMTRDSYRTDWLGRRYLVPKGTRIVTHIARSEGGPVPDLTGFDLVCTYADDLELSAGMRAQGRAPRATKISASAEIITAWGWPGEAAPIPPVDRATVTEVAGPIDLRGQPILDELADVVGWDDDYPYYSDGSWGAVSLRGFWPDDPTRGVKPAEMSKAWKAEHPDDLARECDWTALADRCPAMVSAIQSIPWAHRLERVRLLRMAGTGHGHLGRHTDITDRASGTADGCIVRFHLPLVTHPDIVMSVWELDGERHDLHLAPWKLWYLDARKPHSVANPTDVDRVHLVLDVVADAHVRDAIESGATAT